MKAALFGFRKVFIFLVLITVLLIGLRWTLEAAKVDKEIALQVAAIFTAFCGVLTFAVRAIYDAFQSGYDRDAAIAAAQARAQAIALPPAVPPAPPTP